MSVPKLLQQRARVGPLRSVPLSPGQGSPQWGPGLCVSRSGVLLCGVPWVFRYGSESCFYEQAVKLSGTGHHLAEYPVLEDDVLCQRRLPDAGSEIGAVAQPCAHVAGLPDGRAGDDHLHQAQAPSHQPSQALGLTQHPVLLALTMFSKKPCLSSPPRATVQDVPESSSV